MSDIAKDALRKYIIQIQAHPLRTKALTAGFLAGFSDAFAQKIGGGSKKFQFKRNLLIVLYGFAYAGPLAHFFHTFLDRLFRGKRDATTVVKKVVAEQVILSPWNNFLFMLYYGMIIEGRPWVSVKSKIRKEYLSIQLMAWRIWPLVSWLNHRYIPLQFRVLFGGFASASWAVYMTLKARSALIKQA